MSAVASTGGRDRRWGARSVAARTRRASPRSLSPRSCRSLRGHDEASCTRTTLGLSCPHACAASRERGSSRCRVQCLDASHARAASRAAVRDAACRRASRIARRHASRREDRPSTAAEQAALVERDHEHEHARQVRGEARARRPHGHAPTPRLHRNPAGPRDRDPCGDDRARHVGLWVQSPSFFWMRSTARWTCSSVSKSPVILRCALMTVVWSLPPKRRPMSG